jgi:hypothetical protein
MGVVGQRHAPTPLPPAQRPGTHCTRVWAGPRTGLDGSGKSRLHRHSILGAPVLLRVAIKFNSLYLKKVRRYFKTMLFSEKMISKTVRGRRSYEPKRWNTRRMDERNLSGKHLASWGEISIPRNRIKNVLVRGNIRLIYLEIHLRNDTEFCNRRAAVVI